MWPVFVVQARCELFVIEVQQRACRHDDARLAQSGGGDQHRGVGEQETLAGARADDGRRQELAHAAGRAPQTDRD